MTLTAKKAFLRLKEEYGSEREVIVIKDQKYKIRFNTKCQIDIEHEFDWVAVEFDGLTGKRGIVFRNSETMIAYRFDNLDKVTVLLIVPGWV